MRGLRLFDAAAVPCRAMGGGDMHQDGLIEISQFIGQGAASHGTGDGHNGSNSWKDLGIFDQGLQDVRGPLGVTDEDGLLAGIEGCPREDSP